MVRLVSACQLYCFSSQTVTRAVATSNPWAKSVVWLIRLVARHKTTVMPAKN